MEFEIFLKIILSSLLGGLFGISREISGRGSGIRTIFLNIPADPQHHRDCPQRAENTARPPRIAHIRVHPELLRDEDVVLPHVRVADEDGDDDGVRPFERLLPAGRSLVALDMRAGRASRLPSSLRQIGTRYRRPRTATQA